MTGPKHKDTNDPDEMSSSNRVFLGWALSEKATEPDFTRDGKLAYANTAGDYDGTKTDGFAKSVEIIAADNPSKTVTLYAVWATKYELSFSYHPEMVNPKCGDPKKLQKPETLVSAANKAPTFYLKSQAEADAANQTPTREEGYRWGWWGDNLERFKFTKPESGQSAAQAGNEGCYQYGEPVPARSGGDTSAAPNWDNPTLTLYAYFQPPSACALIFDDNTANTKQFPEYADRNNTYKVTKMPDNAGASTTELEWKKAIPSGDDNTPVHPRYVFVGWSEDKNSTDPEYQPGDEVTINKVLQNKVTLYAIWKPMHNFSLRFNINMPSGSGRIFYKKANGTWDYYTTYANNNNYVYYRSYEANEDLTAHTFLKKDPTVWFTESSFTWSKTLFENEGLFATRADDSVGTYTFFGWSDEPVPVSTEVTAADADYPVESPAIKISTNPSNQGLEPETPTGDQGLIMQSVTGDDGGAVDSKPTTHHKVLYAVWRKSPKHQLRVVFDKGEAKEITGSVKHYIDINGVRQGENNYYASIDYPSYTWDADYWSTNTPTATKDDETDGTATYTFIGWTTDESKKTPSASITKNDIEYPIDDNGHITKDITVSEEAAQAKDCTGGIHDVKLYPVFRKNVKHVYALKYDVNAPSSADGIVTKLYSNESGSWKEAWVTPDPSTLDPAPDPLPDKTDAAGVIDSVIKELSVKSYTWDKSGDGFFVTCDNTGSTPTGEYTFLGWSYTKFKLGEYDPLNPDPNKKLDFPVTAPADPGNIQSGEGVFGQDAEVTIDTDEDPDASDGEKCTEDQGKVHTKTLYAVWAGEPLHQYSVVFAGNSDAPKQDDVEVVYGKKDNWESGQGLAKAKDTLKKTYEKDGVNVSVKYYDAETDAEIALTDDVKNTYRVFSEALPLPKTAPYTDEYTFKESFWNDSTDPDNIRDLIVKAERKDSGDTRYVFDGWNTKPDGTGTDVTVDSDGYITMDLTVRDKNYIDCDSETHNLILYAKWKKVKIHNFNLIFSSEGTNGIGYYQGTTWTAASTKSIRSNDIKDYLVDQSKVAHLPSGSSFSGNKNESGTLDAEGTDKKMSYSWGQSGDSGQAVRIIARKNKDAAAEYEFLGWSKDKKNPNTNYTDADVDYKVDADGNIIGNIEIADPDSPDCIKQSHIMVLYPVFRSIPIHNFSVTLDRNGGTALRTYNPTTGAWSDSTTYTYYKPETSGTKKKVTETDSSYTWDVSGFWSQKGFGAYRNYDNYYTYELVGWSKTKMDPALSPDLSGCISWNRVSEEYKDTARMNKIVNGFINEDIEVTHGTESTGLCTDNGNHNVTLYAVWKKTPRTKTYTLKFDPNGGENAPSDMTQTTTYDGTTSWNNSDFTLTNQQIADAGMKNKELVFVGWHENKQADQGKYGEPNNKDEELKQLTQTLLNPYTITNTKTSTNLADYNVEKTLYAIWWLEYQLDYDANGGSGAPEHEHVYTSDRSYNFRISNDKPTHAAGYQFLGWSENQITPGQGTDADVQHVPSTSSNEQRWNVNAAGSPSDDDYGYTGKKLYAVWGP